MTKTARTKTISALAAGFIVAGLSFVAPQTASAWESGCVSPCSTSTTTSHVYYVERPVIIVEKKIIYVPVKKRKKRKKRLRRLHRHIHYHHRHHRHHRHKVRRYCRGCGVNFQITIGW